MCSCVFPFSPNKAHVGDEFEVQPYVSDLAFTRLESRVHGATESSFCHHQTITLSIQVTLEVDKHEVNFLLQHQLGIPLHFD